MGEETVNELEEVKEVGNNICNKNWNINYYGVAYIKNLSEKLVKSLTDNWFKEIRIALKPKKKLDFENW